MAQCAMCGIDLSYSATDYYCDYCLKSTQRNFEYARTFRVIDINQVSIYCKSMGSLKNAWMTLLSEKERKEATILNPDGSRNGGMTAFFQKLAREDWAEIPVSPGEIEI